MGCDCKKTYNIGMGCCQPVLAPADNFYTKYQTDMRIEEAISGITVSGITEEQAEEMIEEATSGKANSSDVYTKQESDALLANKQDELTAGTGIDITNNVISVTGGIITSGDVIDVVSGYTYDKATIDEKVASGGTFDPTQYYNKTATDELLAEKLDASAYTPVDLSNYYTKSETSGATQIQDALNAKADPYSAGTGISISGNVISATGGSGVVTSIGFNYYSSVSRFDLDYIKDNNFYKDEAFAIGDGLSVDENGGTPIISTTTKFWTGTKAQFDAITVKDNDTIYLVTD